MAERRPLIMRSGIIIKAGSRVADKAAELAGAFVKRISAIPASELIFNSGLVLLVIKVMTQYSEVIASSRFVDEVLSVAASICLIVSVLARRHSTKMLLTFAAVTLLACITAVCVGSLSMILTVLTCIAVCGRELDAVVRLIFRCEAAFVVLNIVTALLHMPFGYTMLTRVSGEMRCNLGFSHPNCFSIILVNLTCMWLWLNYDRIRKSDIVRITFIHLFFYTLTDCRTALLGMIVVLLLFIVFYHRKAASRLLSVMAGAVVPAAAVVVFILITRFTSGDKIVRMVDEALSWRVRLGAYGYEHFGVTFFGQDLSNITVKWDSFWDLTELTFDNVYSYYIVNYGIVWILLVSWLLARTARMGIERHNIFIIVWAMYGVTETHTSNPFMMFSLLLVSVLYSAGGQDGRVYKWIKEKCSQSRVLLRCAEIIRNTADLISLKLQQFFCWLDTDCRQSR